MIYNNIYNNIHKIFKWAGYIVGILAGAQILIVSLIQIDFVVAVGLSLYYLLSLYIAVERPFISGVLLITAGLVVGIPNATINICAGIFWGLLPLISGIAFLIAGIFSWIDEAK